MKFKIDDLNELSINKTLLILNFSLMASYCNTEYEGLFNCYQESANLLVIAKEKLKLSNEDADFLYNFFSENDLY